MGPGVHLILVHHDDVDQLLHLLLQLLVDGGALLAPFARSEAVESSGFKYFTSVLLLQDTIVQQSSISL